MAVFQRLMKHAVGMLEELSRVNFDAFPEGVVVRLG